MALATNPLDSLLGDLRVISNESKRKFPPLREASEAAILKVRTLSSKNNQNIDVRQALYDESSRILEPFIMGCEFKQNQKVVQLSLNAIQRMITHQAVSPVAACKLVDCLWTLMENNQEEVKVLQTATLLLSTNNVVSGPVLARTIVLCFRLYKLENNIVASIASATIRQLISNVFERVENEDAIQDKHFDEMQEYSGQSELELKKSDVDYEELKNFISGHLLNLANALKMQYAPKSLRPHAADAFLLLRDLILILNEEQSLWLVGLTDVNRIFALELLEIAFVSFSDVLARHKEFRYLIKERVCHMILSMFSPDINYHQNINHDENSRHPSERDDSIQPKDVQANNTTNTSFTSVVMDIKISIEENRPVDPNSMRVLRILSMLIQKFYVELLIRGDIFTAIFKKLLENDSNLRQISGSLRLTRLSSADTGNAGTTISTVSNSDIPVVTTMISKLFENSSLLKREHLVAIVDDLCKLNTSPYIIAKLLELSLVNLYRVSYIWESLTEYLLVISRNPSTEVRDWGACALTHLIKQTCNYMQQSKSYAGKDQTNETSGNESDEPAPKMDQRRLLKPLQSLSQIAHPDIRQKQLDVVLQVIQSATSDSALGGWPQIIDIVGMVEEWQTDNLVRIAFQCLQIIVGDYLSQMDCECVLLIIAAIVKFASQLQDLNVSLTAIGLLWNVADYLNENRLKIKDSNPEFNNRADSPNLSFIYEFISQKNLSTYESIWMALFSKLSELCIDPRPAIRKSACQTLFATITTHGDMFTIRTWESILWQILFPLLHNVRMRSSVAPDAKLLPTPPISMGPESICADDDSLNSGCDSIVMHHSRNTAQKQWSETQVLALNGVSKIFGVKRDKLNQMENFSKAWDVLVEFLRGAALSRVFEVSSAALRCFQDLLAIDNTNKTGSDSDNSNENRTGQTDMDVWQSIWVNPINNLLPLCDESLSPELREDFARSCFEVLLQYSHLKGSNISIAGSSEATPADVVNRLAVDRLIQRFTEVIIKYSHDERLAGKCPLPRHRMTEIIFVLRAFATLLRSLKKVPASVAGSEVWNRVLSLYPHLVDFATRNSAAEQMRRDSLNEALLEYGSLLRPPPILSTDVSVQAKKSIESSMSQDSSSSQIVFNDLIGMTDI